LLAGPTLPPERLPEPVHEFAKEVATALANEERLWRRRLAELEALAAVTPKSHLAEQPLSLATTEVLARSRQVLAAYHDVNRDLGWFQSLLAKSATHYRAVGELYVGNLQRTKSAAVQADYRALTDAYRHQASSAEARLHAIGLSAAVRERAARIEEGLCFLERLAEVMAAVPLSEEDEHQLASRMSDHATALGNRGGASGWHTSDGSGQRMRRGTRERSG
jgi:hypothetical protein